MSCPAAMMTRVDAPSLRLAALEQKPTHEIGGRQVVVTGDSDQPPVEVMSHCLDEASLATSGRTFEDNGQTLPVGSLEDVFFIADRHIVRTLCVLRHHF